MKSLGFLFFLFIPMFALADQIEFIIHPGTKWILQDNARTKFNQFLENERLQLVKKIAGLDFPSSFESVDDGISQYMSADSKKFRNRQVACAFLEKMRNRLGPSERVQLDTITKKRKYCIQADLSPSEQLDWTEKLARFIWKSKWIEWNGKRLSLQSYLQEQAGDSSAEKSPRIIVMKKGSFDGWGIAQSQKDLDFFSSLAPVKRAFLAAAPFDPNDPKTFGILGAEFEKFIEKDPFNASNLLEGRPTIFLSNGWPPNAMVELLAHEYGHIFRRLRSEHYSGNEKKVIWLNDEVHEEAAAEAFAWMSLHPLYDSYPEIEIFHISKLMFMNKFSPNNFHYVGAAGLQELFHKHAGNDFNELKRFDSASDLGSYLKSHEILSLINKGPMEDTKLRAVF